MTVLIFDSPYVKDIKTEGFPVHAFSHGDKVLIFFYAISKGL